MFPFTTPSRRGSTCLCQTSVAEREWLACCLRATAEKHGRIWDGDSKVLESALASRNHDHDAGSKEEYHLVLSFEMANKDAHRHPKAVVLNVGWTMSEIVSHVDKRLAETAYRSPYRVVI